MKNFLFFSIALFALSSFIDPPTDKSEITECNLENTTFNSGEKIRFEVFYNWNFVWVKAGYVDFSAEESTYAGAPAYHLKATGKTLKTYDHLYKVRDYYQSYVEKETLKPIKYLRDTDEGGYTQYEELRFDYDRFKINSKKGKTKEKALENIKDYELTGCTFDVVSILYQLRNMDLDNRKKGEKIPIKVFFDQEQYNLYVKYLGVEKVKVKGQGKFKCHKVSPLLIKGNIFTETQKMNVWVTADKNKLPVLIETPIQVGSIKAVIKSAKNLKYPIEAKIK